MAHITPPDDEIPLDMLLTFALEDVNNVLATVEKSETTEDSVAYHLYKRELEDALKRLADRQVGSTLSEVRQDTVAAVAEALPDEYLARGDRKLAQQLQDGGALPPADVGDIDNHVTALQTPIDAEIGHLTRSLGELEFHHEHLKCLSCLDQIPRRETVEVPVCGHTYCKTCTIDLYSRSTLDERLFPPRCCRNPFPATSKRFLSPQLATTFEEKSIEFTTPQRNYCSKRDCSKFIKPEFVDQEHDVARCPACKTKTCTVCKDIAHDRECLEDDSAKFLLELADKEGWQQCTGCKRMVSISHGCNHMTCLCKAQWCYLCTEPWKQCDCAQFTDEHLLGEAQQRVAARGGNVNDARAIDHVVDQIVQQHECGHERMGMEKHSAQCEECGHFMPEYIKVCRGCGIELCNRCLQKFRNRM